MNEHGIDPSQINGTGPGGRITREDVLDYIDANGGRAATPAPAAQPAPAAAAPDPRRCRTSTRQHCRAAPAAAAPAPAPAAAARPGPAPQVAVGERDTPVKLSKIRRLTGDHMVMSKATSPHAFSVVEVDFAGVDVTRSKAKGEWKASEGFSLTYLPFISRAIIDALAEFPHLNASVADDALVVHNYIDLGIAVDLAYEGLLAPVIRNAETKRLRAIAREISDLANRAKTRKLSPDEIQGGTFTISNNGSAGSVLTMPIINQPQVAIISTDSIVRRPVAVALPDGAEAIVVHPVGNLAMSWDHRAFDGAYAAGFLKRVKEIIETRATGTPRSDVTQSKVAGPLRVRWLGRVPYREALAVQTALFEHGREQHLLLLEHTHVFTHGPRSDLATNLRCDPAAVGADLVAVKRGGDITYHGPGQLVGYPILSVGNALGAAAHVHGVEQLLIDALAELGLAGVGCLDEYPGVWVDAEGPNPRKIAAIGVRLARGRTMHGFALNVATDLTYMRQTHRAVRHRRPAGDVARRGGHRRIARTGRRCRGPARRRALGGRRG